MFSTQITAAGDVVGLDFTEGIRDPERGRLRRPETGGSGRAGERRRRRKRASMRGGAGIGILTRVSVSVFVGTDDPCMSASELKQYGSGGASRFGRVK